MLLPRGRSFRFDLAALDAMLIQAADRISTALQSLVVVIQQMNGESRGQTVIGDTGAHRASAEHGNFRNLPAWRVLVDAGDLGDFALAEENVYQRFALRMRQALLKTVPFHRKTGLEIVAIHGRLDALDDHFGRICRACGDRLV